jgi:BirA family biotin operon repressor/biotin-[acetyl-CoA-carboxylase] ligase
MDVLEIPSLLTALARAGKSGIVRRTDLDFQKELEICQSWGYRISATHNRVSIDFDHDQLVPLWIQRETPAIVWNYPRVQGFLRIGSTNSEALEQARKGAPDGTLIFAEEQTSGRGRKDHIWFSPAGAGLYFTLVLRPKQAIECWTLLTHMASIALVETLSDLSDHNAASSPLAIDIKWPNDILISGKKCAGILCETLILSEDSRAAVVGVGINVRRGSIGNGLDFEASCLDEMSGTIVPRRRLLVRFLGHFQECYRIFEHGNHGQLLERWKRYSSMYKGVEVYITDGNTRRMATTCGLSEDGALLVRTEEGLIERILAGDICIRSRS